MKLNSSISNTSIPKLSDNYSKDISVIVFYPSDDYNDQSTSNSFYNVIQSIVPDWFDKYVIVFPVKYDTSWVDIKNEYENNLKTYGLSSKDLSISIFSIIGNSIKSNLSSLKINNLILMNPLLDSDMSNSIQKSIQMGSKSYLIYNSDIKNDYLDQLNKVLKYDGLTSLKTDVKKEDIPITFLKKYKSEIEVSLTTPRLLNESQSPSDKKTDNNNVSKSPENNSDPGVIKYDLELDIDENTGIIIGARKTVPEITVYIGGVDPDPLNSDDFEDTLDPAYVESMYSGSEELGITYEQYKLELDIASSQEAGDTGLTPPGTPANIKPVGDLDGLLKLAGDCARELGKNSRVCYDNLRRGYIKGVHGLCPQGTQAVVYAMTGVKKLGQISGNADYFSFRYSKSKFPSSHYNDKIKIDKSYWKDKSLWQVGDVVAVGYTDGKPYGHIQVWTGFCWMSDFKQNALQSSHVDWDTPALWRLNDSGLAAVKKQLQTLA